MGRLTTRLPVAACDQRPSPTSLGFQLPSVILEQDLVRGHSAEGPGGSPC
jgi:hypothetical protein